MSVRGHCILSHGFESGPDATKVAALAEVAERMGWSHERPDYTGFDAMGGKGRHGDVAARLAHLQSRASACASEGPLVLAGSSLGAWISGTVSLRVPVRALFLMAPPVNLVAEHPLQAAAVPTAIIHGWKDELIPAADVVAWARARGDRLLLVDDDHRLSKHVDASSALFAVLLGSLAP